MTPLDDAELRDLLEARASRGEIDLQGLVVEGRHQALAAPRAGRRSPLAAVLAGFGGVAAVALVVALVVVPLVSRPAASTGPNASAVAASGEPSQGPDRTTLPPAAVVQPITATDLGELLRARPDDLAGRTLAVDGAIDLQPRDACTDACQLVVSGLDVPHELRPTGDQGPGPWDGSGPQPGLFAIRVTGETDRGAAVLELVGELVAGPDGLTTPLETLAAGKGRDHEGLLLAVRGWLVRTSFQPCPLTTEVGPYGCGTEDYLSATSFQPTRPDGSTTIDPPAPSVRVRMGAYDAWAPNPAPAGAGAVQPREATYLLRWTVVSPCGPLADCYVPPEDAAWQVVGRLDPVPAPAATPEPIPSPTLHADGGAYPGGIPRAIDGEPVLVGLDAQARWREATDDTPFLVGGWFRSGIVTACSPPPGQYLLVPLESRDCPRYVVTGIPGRAFYPEGLTLPDGDGPIVLRVHTHDAGSTACTTEGQADCRERTVVESVAWSDGPAAKPIGPVQARSMATSVFVMEWRDMTDKMQMAVDEDVFTVPIACPDPWPTLLFSVHGDPRYGLIAVFPDTGTRERFEAGTDPELGAKCLDLPIERPAGARWVGRDNVLVFADDAFATRLADVLADPQRQQRALPMTDPGFDRTLATVTDYLVARAAGELDHAWGERLIDPNLDEATFEARHLDWVEDAGRRAAANALDGRLEVLDEAPTEASVGADAWRVVHAAGVTRARIVKVTYDGATDPALAAEEYLVIQIPESEFRDWQLIRLGEP